MCGYAELTSSDPEVRAQHWMAVAPLIVVIILVLTGTIFLVTMNSQEKLVENVPAEVENL